MIVVLGSFPDYLDIAAAICAECFSLPIDSWNAMSRDRQWATNRAFLDRAVAQDAIFVCAIPPDEAEIPSYFARECNHLISVGFKCAEA